MIVKVCGSPVQLFAIGVTVTFAVKALFEVLVARNDRIFPVALPLAFRPMLILSLAHM